MSAPLGRSLLTVLLGAAYLGLLLTAVVPTALGFLMCATVVVVAEIAMSRREGDVLTALLGLQLDTRFRLLSLDVLTAVLAARSFPHDLHVVVLAVVAVVLLHGGRDAAGIFARRREWRRNGGPVSWRNLTVPGLPQPVSARLVPQLAAGLALLSLLMPLGFTIGELTDRVRAGLVAEAVVIAVVVLFLAGRVLQYVVLNRTSRDAVREAVRARLEELAPEIVVHFSGRRGTVEQVLVWVPELVALDRRVVVLVREPTHLDALDGCGLPVVFAPRSQDVELFTVPSVSVALYPSDATNINNHLIRVPGVLDVLIGHGDSDEPENRSPIARMYDEVWVAGPAGRARYDWAASGLPQSRIREIGPVRPLARPLPDATAGPRRTVVYAPAWENVVDSADLSSLVTHGDAVLEALLARQDVRVLFVPPAAAGSRLPEYLSAADRLRARVRAAGPVHAVLEPDQAGAAVADAALAVVDVSPLLGEAIRCGTPVAVCAIDDRPDEALREVYPTLEAAAILWSLPEDVFLALDDALGPDTRAARRAAVAAREDGVAAEPLSTRFAAAIEDAIAVQGRRRAFVRPAAARER